MSRRTLWVIVLLALVLGGAYLYWDNASGRKIAQQARQELRSAQGEESDYYGDGLVNRQYDKEGRLEQSFAAAKSAHYASTASTFFEGRSSAPKTVMAALGKSVQKRQHERQNSRDYFAKSGSY